jgi:PAS domain-containing protein
MRIYGTIGEARNRRGSMTLAMTGSGGHELGGNGRTGPTAVAPGSLWTKALGRYVGLPMFVLDAEGNLAYFNETAAALLGRSYTEIGPLPPEEWGALWTPTNVEGAPIPVDRLPVMVALLERRPVHAWLHIVGLDGVRRRVEATAFPLEEPDGALLGAVVLFWEQADA